MGVNSARKVRLEHETEIAVLQNEVKNLNEKIDDLKLHIKELHDSTERNMEETRRFLKQFQEENDEAHAKVVERIANLERIKWMLFGAAAVIGATGAEAFKMFMQHIVG